MSQSRDVLSEAKRVSAYVTALYGKEQFGVLRLLTGFESFRAVESRSELYKLLGRSPMLSFERVLRESTGIVYMVKQDGVDRKFIITGPGGRREYIDDQFSTVAARLVQQIVSFNPELCAFKPSPLVQLGGGLDFSKLSDLANNEDMDDFIRSLPEQYAAHRAEWDNAKPVVDNPASSAVDKIVAQAKLVTSVHNIFSMLRGDDNINFDKPGEPLPFARPEESGAVFMGAARLSLQFPSTPPDAMKTMLGAMHSDGVWEGNNFIIRGTYDPFVLIGSSRLESSIDRNVYNAILGSTENEIPPVTSVVPESTSCEGFVADAVRLVLEYVDANVAILTPAEQQICKYGSPSGEELWERVSTQKRKKFMKCVPAGVHRPEAFLRFMADFIISSVSSRSIKHARDPFDLAAGRTLACKGQIDFCEGGWAKK